MPTLRELTTTWGFNVDDSELKAMEQTERKLRGGFIKLGVVATAALAAVILPAASVQASIKDTLTLVETTGTAFDKLEKGMTDKALALSNKLGISASEVAVGFYQVLSTGAEALSPRFNALSEIGLKMAKTVGLAPADAIEKVNDTLGAFSLAASDAARVADVLFKGSILGATTVPQLTDAMKFAAPAAADFGTSLEETVALLDIMANKGLKGAQAGTGLSGVLARLKDPTDKVKGALAKLNVQLIDSKTGKFRKFTDILLDMRTGLGKLSEAQQGQIKVQIAGQEHSKTLTGLISGLNAETIKYEKTLEKAEGALDRAFVIKMGSANEQFNLLKVRVTNLAAKIGAPLLGPLTKIIKAISEAGEKLTTFLDQNKEVKDLTALFIGLASGVSLVVAGLGILVTSIKIFAFTAGAVGGFAFAPFILLIALVGILSLVLITVQDELKELIRINKTDGVTGIAKDFLAWLTGVENITEALKDLNTAWKDFAENPFKETGAIINEFFGLIREKRKKGFTFGEATREALFGQGALDFLAPDAGLGAARNAFLNNLSGATLTGAKGGLSLTEAEQRSLNFPTAGKSLTISIGGITIDTAGNGDPDFIADQIGERLDATMRNTATDLGIF